MMLVVGWLVGTYEYLKNCVDYFVECHYYCNLGEREREEKIMLLIACE